MSPAQPAGDLGTSRPANDIGLIVATNVRRIRMANQVSISELARRSGVAKATLSSLESEFGNPTVETLSMIASALGCPLADLITSAVPEVVLAREAQWIEGDELRGRLITRLAGPGGVDVHEVVIDPGGSLDDQPLPGSVEHFFVLAGSLCVDASGSVVVLEQGDGMRIPSGLGYQVTAGTTPARLLIFVSGSAARGADRANRR